MFTSWDLSLVRERNANLLREVSANRLAKRLRASRGLRPRSRRTFRSFSPRGFALPSAGPGRAGCEGVRPEDA